MAKSYSQDLRDRVIGLARLCPEISTVELGQRFRISQSTAWRYRKRAREGESSYPDRRHGMAPQVTDAHRAWVQGELQAHPTLSSYEVTERFHQVFPETPFHRSTILRIIHTLGLTKKKRRHSPRSESVKKCKRNGKRFLSSKLGYDLKT